MTDEELKKKCTERAKIFQQAMESCHSSSTIDCIEWFADRIAELEKENEDTQYINMKVMDENSKLEKENAELESIVRNTKAVDESFALQSIQLIKAKELLKRCYENYIYLEPLRSEIEQFLNGEDCPDCLCEDCTKDCGIKKLGLVEENK